MSDVRSTEQQDLPAFPFVIDSGAIEPWLTKRELFAAMALQGWLAGCRNAYSEFTGPAASPHVAAEACVKFADELLDALEKPRG